MGKGRAPCCDKDKVKRGPWSPQEDLRLITFIQKHGHENWRSLPKQAGLLRCGKSCRLRWINYLRPDVKRGNFSKEEEETIIRLHESWGNKWSKIASHLVGRTDNEIKNVWHTHLKKRLASSKGNISQNGESKISCMASSSSSSITYVSSSCGERNIEAFEEPKALSSSSISSSNSNVTNTSQVDPSNPENRGGSPHDVVGVYGANNASEEVNKPEISDTDFDIPLESDLDFWNTLDSLGSFHPDEVLTNDKWLQYMEIELGLDKTRSENQTNLSNNAAEVLVPEMFDILPKP